VAATNLLLALLALLALLPLLPLLVLVLSLLLAVLLLPGESPDSSCRMNTGKLLELYSSGREGCTHTGVSNMAHTVAHRGRNTVALLRFDTLLLLARVYTNPY
jgi:hypothetical protein